MPIRIACAVLLLFWPLARANPQEAVETSVNSLKRDTVLFKQMARVRSVSFLVSAPGYAGKLKSAASNDILNVLEHWGVDTTSTHPDAHLSVEIHAEPWGQKYEDHKTHYVGAKVNGEVSLFIGYSRVFAKSFKGIEYPPNSIHISSTPGSPYSAPFGSAFDASNFNSILLDLTFHKVGLGNFIRVAADLHLDPSRNRLHELMNAESDPYVVLAELLKEKPRRDPSDEKAVLRNEYLMILEIVLDLIEERAQKETIAYELLALATDSTIISSRMSTGSIREISRVPDRIKRRAIALLGQCKYQQGVEDLILLLKHGTESVSVSAAEALGEIGDERALEPLIATLVSTWREPIREASFSALRSISNEEFDDDEEQWVLWWESSTGRKVAAYHNRGLPPLLVWILSGIIFVIIGVLSWYADSSRNSPLLVWILVGIIFVIIAVLEWWAQF